MASQAQWGWLAISFLLHQNAGFVGHKKDCSRSTTTAKQIVSSDCLVLFCDLRQNAKKTSG